MNKITNQHQRHCLTREGAFLLTVVRIIIKTDRRNINAYKQRRNDILRIGEKHFSTPHQKAFINAECTFVTTLFELRRQGCRLTAQQITKLFNDVGADITNLSSSDMTTYLKDLYNNGYRDGVGVPTVETLQGAFITTASDIQNLIFNCGHPKTFRLDVEASILRKSIRKATNDAELTLELPVQVNRRYGIDLRDVLHTIDDYSYTLTARLLRYMDNLNIRQNGVNEIGKSTLGKTTYISFSVIDYARATNERWVEYDRTDQRFINGIQNLSRQVERSLDFLRRATFTERYKDETELIDNIRNGGFADTWNLIDGTFFVQYNHYYNRFLTNIPTYLIPYQYFQIPIERTTYTGAVRMVVMDKLSSQLGRGGNCRTDDGTPFMLMATLFKATIGTGLPRTPDECVQRQWRRKIVAPMERALDYCVEVGVFLKWEYDAKDYATFDEWLSRKVIYQPNNISYVETKYYPKKKKYQPYNHPPKRRIHRTTKALLYPQRVLSLFPDTPTEQSAPDDTNRKGQPS